MNIFMACLFILFGFLLLCHSLVHYDYFPDNITGKMEYQLIQIKAIVLMTSGFLFASVGDICNYTKKLLQEKEKESTKEKEKE